MILQLDNIDRESKIFRIHKSREVSDIRSIATKWLAEVVPESLQYSDFWLLYRGQMLDSEDSLSESEIFEDSKIHVRLERLDSVPEKSSSLSGPNV